MCNATIKGDVNKLKKKIEIHEGMLKNLKSREKRGKYDSERRSSKPKPEKGNAIKEIFQQVKKKKLTSSLGSTCENEDGATETLTKKIPSDDKKKEVSDDPKKKPLISHRSSTSKTEDNDTEMTMKNSNSFLV